MQTTRASLAFAIILAVFIIGPALLPATFGPYPLLRWGDALDLATPVAVLPAAWLLFRRAGNQARTADGVLFAALAGVWASAQGMHLAANAIGHLVAEGTGDVWTLTNIFDEVLSHYLWHGALLALTGLIAWRALRGLPETDVPAGGRLAIQILAAAVFGFTFFVMVVEGGTAMIGLPGAALVSGYGLVVGRGSLARRPAASLFVIGYLLALVLCAVWAGLHDWQLVEFSKAGLID